MTDLFLSRTAEEIFIYYKEIIFSFDGHTSLARLEQVPVKYEDI